MARVSYTLLPSALGKPISPLGLVHGEPLGTDGLDNVVAAAVGQLAHALHQLHGPRLLLPHRHQVRRAQLVAQQVGLDLSTRGRVRKLEQASWTSSNKDSREIPSSEACCTRQQQHVTKHSMARSRSQWKRWANRCILLSLCLLDTPLLYDHEIPRNAILCINYSILMCINYSKESESVISSTAGSRTTPIFQWQILQKSRIKSLFFNLPTTVSLSFRADRGLPKIFRFYSQLCHSVSTTIPKCWVTATSMNRHLQFSSGLAGWYESQQRNKLV